MPARLLTLLTLLSAPAWAQKQIATDRPLMEAPYSLTAADGTGLRLVALDARAVVDGPLAFTELHLTFENPQPRQIEGHFKITMPDGAAISRFAMKIRGAWMEGEVVEKQAARRAYEDALHRRQDPALLEQDAGNAFRARVFPINPRERKELIISWSQELTAAGEAYRLPLKGLPKVESLRLTALTAAAAGGGVQTSLGGTTSRYQVSKVEKRGFTPDQDWVISGGTPTAGGEALRTGNLAVTRFVVPGGDVGGETFSEAVVLFDTSASRAIGFAGRTAALRELVRGLASVGVKTVTVVAFDQVSEQIYQGAPSGFGDKATKRLAARDALGASSFSAAFDALEQTKGAGRRVLFVTDGMVTAGERDPVKIRERTSALKRFGVQRVDVVVDTTARDPGMLEALVQSDLPSAGRVVEGRQPLQAQLQRLGGRTLADVRVHVPGAQWVWPAKLRGLQGGDTIVAFADLPPEAPLRVELSGDLDLEVKPQIRSAERPLLERAWVGARIKRLQHLQTAGDPDLKGALKHQIIALSTRHRVLSPYTALVVLETEADYARFGIDRKGLADILVVGATGVELTQRAAAQIAVRPPPPPPPPRRSMEKARKKTKGAARGRADRAPRAAAEEGGMDDAFAASAAAPADEAPAVESKVMAAPEPPSSTASGGARPRAKRMARRTRRPPPTREPSPFPAERRRPPTQEIATAQPTGESVGRRELREIEKGRPALTGQMAAIVKDLRGGRLKRAQRAAKAWHAKNPADLLGLVALGQTLSLKGDQVNAARAFGGILDLYPSRADMRRLAGNWLERLGDAGLSLAVDTYQVAAEQRPDHPAVYHQLAMGLLRLGRYEAALELLLRGLSARRAGNRFPGVDRILQEDAQLAAAAWAAAEPSARGRIAARLEPHGLRIDDRATLRFVLTWETDANDVDFHIFDGKFNHAYYSRRGLASGGELYADVTTGYGPECFTIHDPKGYPYKLKAHYYRRGPMGYGAGKLQIIRHDGKGRLGFEDRPFVIMSDGAYVDLGTVSKRSARLAKTMPKPQAVAR